MSNIGSAEISEPGGHELSEENVILANTNALLQSVGIHAKPISSFYELQKIASSMFVAIFEAMFDFRLKGIIRKPGNRDDYVRNAQMVVDALSQNILKMGLGHITGEAIVDGDSQGIKNLVDILIAISEVWLQQRWQAGGSADERSSQQGLSARPHSSEPTIYSVGGDQSNTDRPKQRNQQNNGRALATPLGSVQHSPANGSSGGQLKRSVSLTPSLTAQGSSVAQSIRRGALKDQEMPDSTMAEASLFDDRARQVETEATSSVVDDFPMRSPEYVIQEMEDSKSNCSFQGDQRTVDVESGYFSSKEALEFQDTLKADHRGHRRGKPRGRPNRGRRKSRQSHSGASRTGRQRDTREKPRLQTAMGRRRAKSLGRTGVSASVQSAWGTKPAAGQSIKIPKLQLNKVPGAVIASASTSRRSSQRPTDHEDARFQFSYDPELSEAQNQSLPEEDQRPFAEERPMPTKEQRRSMEDLDHVDSQISQEPSLRYELPDWICSICEKSWTEYLEEGRTTSKQKFLSHDHNWICNICGAHWAENLQGLMYIGSEQKACRSCWELAIAEEINFEGKFSNGLMKQLNRTQKVNPGIWKNHELRMKGIKRDQKIRMIKKHRQQEELLRKRLSKRLDRRTEGEVHLGQVYASLLHDAAERAREEDKYAAEQLRFMERRWSDQISSLQTYFQDRLEMAEQEAGHRERDHQTALRAQDEAMRILMKEQEAFQETELKNRLLQEEILDKANFTRSREFVSAFAAMMGTTDYHGVIRDRFVHTGREFQFDRQLKKVQRLKDEQFRRKRSKKRKENLLKAYDCDQHKGNWK